MTGLPTSIPLLALIVALFAAAHLYHQHRLADTASSIPTKHGPTVRRGPHPPASGGRHRRYRARGAHRGVHRPPADNRTRHPMSRGPAPQGRPTT